MVFVVSKTSENNKKTTEEKIKDVFNGKWSFENVDEDGIAFGHYICWFIKLILSPVNCRNFLDWTFAMNKIRKKIQGVSDQDFDIPESFDTIRNYCWAQIRFLKWLLCIIKEFKGELSFCLSSKYDYTAGAAECDDNDDTEN